MDKLLRPIWSNVNTRRSPLILRNFETSSHAFANPSFKAPPSPPKLPKEEQEVYERLQRDSTGAFSTPRASIIVNQPSTSSEGQEPFQTSRLASDQDSISNESGLENTNAKVTANGDGEELHPHVRRGAKPEFEGDTNPKTGEVGGPKNEPLRWGGNVDWSYNGRVTDF